MPKFKNIVATICVLGASYPALAQRTGSSSATAASVQLSVGSTAKATTSVAPVQGSAPGTYDNTNGATGVANNWLLIGGVTSAYDLLNIGAATTEAKSSTGSTLTYTTGTTTLTNVNSTLETILAFLPTIGLGISADTIISTTTAGIDANGALYSNGTSSLANLNLTGTLLSGLGLNLGLLASATPNTVAVSLAGLKLTLNEQLVAGTATSIFQQTNAAHLTFNQFSYDGGLLNGDVILGHSEAQISAVPEPATWALMLVGFGFVGALLRVAGRRDARQDYGRALSVDGLA